MLQLQKITTVYDDCEDRVQLCGELANGETLQLWLTLRLLNRLVAHLCHLLEGQGADDLQTQVRNSFAQQAAAQSHTGQAPVQLRQPKTRFLVHVVDVVQRPDALQLLFKEGSASSVPAVSLNLQHSQLRQWFNILYNQYRLAGWPLGVWPEWAALEPGTATSPAPVLH